METYPSIFNDVIGPVMRGPSSSHCAASLRIGRLCRDLMGGDIRDVLIEFDPNGSLATTHKGQGSDMGLFGGFLGWEAHDERLPQYLNAVEEAGMRIDIRIHPLGATHPNWYQITLHNDLEKHTMIALSTGGGMIRVIAVDSATVDMGGDFFETLVYTDEPDALLGYLSGCDQPEEFLLRRGEKTYVQIRTVNHPEEALLAQIRSFPTVTAIRILNPVLPVRSRKNLSVPFTTASEMLEYNRDHQLTLWELAVRYESIRGGITETEVMDKMRDIIRIMRGSVNTGLQGTHWEDRILGSQSLRFRESLQNGRLVKNDVLNTVIMYVSAIMEVKSSMGVIVAAPTAGSCGALPGTILGTADALGLSEEEMTKAMLAAGLIGVFIALHATFAAEVGGCMAECGSGCGMAAAGLVVLQQGTLGESLAAASMALQTSLGMVCDTIADRVEAPCLNRNVMAGSQAISCANMALAGYQDLIPLDQVIETMKRVGDAIPNTLRCTGLGGLAITAAAKEIEARLNKGEGIGIQSGFKVC